MNEKRFKEFHERISFEIGSDLTLGFLILKNIMNLIRQSTW